MPRHGLIRWSMATTSESVTISIEDEGPGIPTEEIPLVTSRFFRGRHKSALGSGLGLSIVEVALRANDAELHLSNRTDRSGLRADMVWRFRRDPSQARLKSERPLVATDQVWQQPLRAV
jgi:two-component system sensor histidine kinase QseC